MQYALKSTLATRSNKIGAKIFQKSYSHRKQSLNICFTLIITVIATGVDLKTQIEMKGTDKEKKRSLEHHLSK